MALLRTPRQTKYTAPVVFCAGAALFLGLGLNSSISTATDLKRPRGPSAGSNVSVDLSVLKGLGSPEKRSGTASKLVLKPPSSKTSAKIRAKKPTTSKPRLKLRRPDGQAARTPSVAAPATPPPVRKVRPTKRKTVSSPAPARPKPPKPPVIAKPKKVEPQGPDIARVKPVPPSPLKAKAISKPDTNAGPKTRTVALPTPEPSKTVAAKAPVKPAAKRADAGKVIRVPFASGGSKLNANARREVDKIASHLKNDTRLRLEVMAYAADIGGSPKAARRMSLYRALAVRSRLIKTGVLSTRIAVRPMGDKSTYGPPDRVDLVVSAR